MAEKRPSLLIAEAHKFAGDLGESLIFKHPDPSCNSQEGSEEVAEGTKEKADRKKAEMDKLQEKENIEAEKWRMICRMTTLISFPYSVSRPLQIQVFLFRLSYK